MAERFIRRRDEVLLEDLALKINNERMASREPIIRTAARSRIQLETVKKLIYTGRSTTVTLLRIADALNCEVVLIRRTRKKKIWEIEGAEEQLYKLNKIQTIAKQNERKRKNSQRQRIEDAERERDFLNGDDAE